MSGATAATIRVSPEKLIATSQEFSTQGSQMSALTSEMVNKVTSLASVWEGEAASSYVNKFKALENDIRLINAMIQEHVSDLQEMGTLYNQAESDNVNDAGSLITSAFC